VRNIVREGAAIPSIRPRHFLYLINVGTKCAVTDE